MNFENVRQGFAPVVLASAFMAATAWLYFRLMHSPLPGIPYRKGSERRLMGDVADMLKWRKHSGETWSFLRNVALDLQSPIFQIFMQVGQKPWVVLTDFRESYDIQTSRQGEFDRSSFLGNVFGPLLPGNHVWMPSNEEFRAHRSLIRDTMSPEFLNKTVAPVVYEQTQNLLRLWSEKTRLARGRPFQADDDVIRNLVDVILSATYGMEAGVINGQLSLLAQTSSIRLPDCLDAPPSFPEVREPRIYTAIRTLVNSIQIGMSSPFPKYHMLLALHLSPSLVLARYYTKWVTVKVLQKSWSKFSQDPESPVHSAADLLVRREIRMASKELREARYNTQAIRDELFGFYLAGHETTSTTLCWAFKHATAHQDAQQKLRQALHSTHTRAYQEGRLPTPDEIVHADCPYLDAFIEENHRLGLAIPSVIRRATKDCVVLGHNIPKGTDVFMLMNGPDFQQPGFLIEENLRSAKSRELKAKYASWDDADVSEFKPERFLKRANGHVTFNAFAGPVLPFGAGLRGCFGVKLAVIELKIIITMAIWSFEFRDTPLQLSSFRGLDVNTHRAQQTYVRLTKTG